MTQHVTEASRRTPQSVRQTSRRNRVADNEDAFQQSKPNYITKETASIGSYCIQPLNEGTGAEFLKVRRDTVENEGSRFGGTEFVRRLNFWVMFLHVTGVENCLVFTPYIDDVVYAELSKGRDWRVVHELFVIYLHMIEDYEETRSAMCSHPVGKIRS